MTDWWLWIASTVVAVAALTALVALLLMETRAEREAAAQDHLEQLAWLEQTWTQAWTDDPTDRRT